MPFPNEHAARIRQPSRFVRFARKNDEFASGIDVIFGITDEGMSEVQAIRFDKTKFTVAQAKEWLGKHDFKTIEFEPASEGVQEQDDAASGEVELPKNSKDMTVRDTLGAAQEQERKFNLEEAEFVKKAPNAETACGTCRFYLRSPSEESGLCQVVEGPISWFSSCAYFISAEADAKAIFDAVVQEGVRPAFGSPGGKKLLARTIVGLIPDHEKYVEPFIGGGAVFFAKKKSAKEAINDGDCEIAHAYQFMQRMEEDDVVNLETRNNKFDRSLFFKLRDSEPTTDLDKFYKFLYTNAMSFGRSRTSTVRDASGMSSSHVLHKRYRRLFERVKPRLDGVEITGVDFREVIAKHDSPTTFFYLDPPYPTQQGHLKTDLTNEDILETVKGIKGKFILSLPGDPATRKVFAEFQRKLVTVTRTFENRNGNRHNDMEMLISNFPLKASQTWFAEGEARETILATVIGNRKEPVPFGIAGMIEPQEAVVGPAALGLFMRLTREAKDQVYRCAILNDDGQPQEINQRAKYTESDLNLRYIPAGAVDPILQETNDGEFGTWRGLEDNCIWTMATCWPRAKKGEFKYGETFPADLEGDMALGESLISIAVDAVQEWREEDGKNRWSTEYTEPQNIIQDQGAASSIKKIRETSLYVRDPIMEAYAKKKSMTVVQDRTGQH